jgi:uncharacterized protein YecT (DUF1311 family)
MNAAVATLCLSALTGVGFAVDVTEILYTSPSDAVRLERTGEDIWVVSVKEPAQRAKLPKVHILGDWAYPDEFDFSPNDEWIFASYHVGSCLQDAVLYHRTSATKIDLVEDFNTSAWKNAAKLRSIKEDYAGAGECAMTFFGGWSFDSGRLLIGLLGGGDKRDLRHGYLYFNTHTKNFETTNYLLKMSAANSQVLACAEPLGSFPLESELKARFDMLDKKLNDVYSAKLSKIAKNGLQNLRGSQRNWLKARDKGLELYRSFAPATQREQRRLQFLGDVTAARIGSLNESEDNEPFDFWERISDKP